MQNILMIPMGFLFRLFSDETISKYFLIVFIIINLHLFNKREHCEGGMEKPWHLSAWKNT